MEREAMETDSNIRLYSIQNAHQLSHSLCVVLGFGVIFNLFVAVVVVAGAGSAGAAAAFPLSLSCSLSVILSCLLSGVIVNGNNSARIQNGP